ncbi:phage transcriptional regulator, ArpU family protein (plasmid) [Anoxybacillus sp. B7M1]|uniref:ArpU family phage packaging/lysis transcriptional regulator n=1 Tax=Anoxybacillus sp. B7M1 TaxID=1490057 RepID=UPI0005CCF9CF|nr:ArpU family phage packaging/lysis transcriptional regulator [Anoxybacillus sp. B7M1]ANB66171.1 phage transcriptional regulator, ArpU family protein [Anoxybacillus sp. B7M1]
MGAKHLTNETSGMLDDKQVEKTVISELKNYRALKVRMENLKERERAGVKNLFPELRQSQFMNELKFTQIERALKNSLDAIERQIIEMKYLSPVEINDIDIYMELGLTKKRYYAKKRTAIERLATALGII